MKGNVIQMNTLHLNSVRLNGIGKVQSVSLKGGSTEDPVFPPVEPPVEPTPTYTLSASVTNGMVSATLNGSAVNLPFTANEGDVIVLEVTPNDGYAFEGWNDGNTDNPRTITMNADVVLSAECVEVVQPPVGKYIQFEDAEVERVLMSKGVSSDGVGITKADAENVTSISTWFKGNTTIQSFDEFRFFTGVTSLIGEPFNGAKALKSIKLPSSIANIGDYAFFNCTSLETIEMHDSITYIGNSAFFYCSALSGDVELPKLTSVGANGFRTTKITSFYAPLLSVIYAEAFNGCTELKKVYLESVTSIGNYAFLNCKVLEEIVVKTQTPPTLSGSVFGGSTCPIYVPDASLEAYKTAVNWSAYADRIHPLSEIEDYYVSDALLMHLDGINKGNVEGEWQDLVSGNTFVNHGAIAEADGWRFDGASSYMDSATLENYGPSSKNRTFEIVAEFDRANITEVVYMGKGLGYAFGRYEGGKCIIITTTSGFPSFADDMTSGVRIFSASLSNKELVASEINGNDGQVRGAETFSGSGSFIYLGKRASGNHFKGIIHSIRIHDRALSKEEILYNQRIDNKRFNLGLDI